MANINYNKSHININIDIWFVLAFYTFILVIVIFNVTKYKIKSIETSPERVLRLKNKKEDNKKYYIKKKLIPVDTEIEAIIHQEKETISLSIIRNDKRKYEDLGNQLNTPKSKRIKSNCLKTPEQLKKQIYNIKQNTKNKNDSTNSINKFKDLINEVIDQVCAICHRKFYKEGVKNFNVNEKIYSSMLKANFKFNIGDKIKTCHSCHSILTANKIPAISYTNQLNPGTIPIELLDLNSIELSCLSRVKPYMKIMKMNNIYGQSSFKGNVVHFAQSIEEIYEQLPLKLIDTDNIIVTEKRANVDTIKQFNVRPKKLYEGLLWLKNNNKLYSNVQIIDRPDIEYHVDNIVVEEHNNLQLPPVITDKNNLIVSINFSNINPIDALIPIVDHYFQFKSIFIFQLLKLVLNYSQF